MTDDVIAGLLSALCNPRGKIVLQSDRTLRAPNLALQRQRQRHGGNGLKVIAPAFALRDVLFGQTEQEKDHLQGKWASELRDEIAFVCLEHFIHESVCNRADGRLHRLYFGWGEGGIERRAKAHVFGAITI